jgi:RHS repeat-associated protein
MLQRSANPINPLTMSKIEVAVDYEGPSSSGLVFARTYHSGAFPLTSISNMQAQARYAVPARIGARWRHTWDRRFVQRPSYDQVARAYETGLYLIKEDGQEVPFVRDGHDYVPSNGERGRVTKRGDEWLYMLPDLTLEAYDDRGRLRSRTDSSGNIISLQYVELGQGLDKVDVLSTVTDAQGRQLKLDYTQGLVTSLTLPDGGIVRYDYSSASKGADAELVRATYPDGRNVQYLYDERDAGGTPSHKLTGIVGSDGVRFASFRYDRDNRAVRTEHGNGDEWTELSQGAGSTIPVLTPDSSESWRSTYIDGRARLGSRARPFHGVDIKRTFDYSPKGFVTRQTDYTDTATTYLYDSARKLEIERTVADGTAAARTIHTTWHPSFDKPTRIDTDVQWTTLEYDTQGNVVACRQGGVADASDPASGAWPDERVTRYSYSPRGQLLSVDGPLAGVADSTIYGYHENDAPNCAGSGCSWRAGDLHTIRNALGHTATVLARDGAGRVTSSSDVNGVRTDVTYDAVGRVTRMVKRMQRDGKPSSGDAIIKMSYNANGDVESLTDADGLVIRQHYNLAHRLTDQFDGMGHWRHLGRDETGRVNAESFGPADGPAQVERTFSYDSLGHLARVDTADAAIVLESDPHGRGLRQAGALKSQSVSRDPLGRIVARTDGDGPDAPVTRFIYDHSDRLKSIVDPNGLTTSYLRNGLGDLLWQKSPDTGITRFDYDEAGRITRVVTADDREMSLNHDVLGRVTRADHGGAQTVFIYDMSPSGCPQHGQFAIGHVSSVETTDTSTQFCYDFAGRVVQKMQATKGVGLTIGYAFTSAGRLSSVRLPSGVEVRYHYDAAGRPSSVVARSIDGHDLPVVSDIEVDASGDISGWVAGNRSIRLAYDGLGRTRSVKDLAADGLAMDVSYLNAEVRSIQSGSVTTRSYYDHAGRVTYSFSLDATQRPPLYSTHTYTYDMTGNRLTWLAGASSARTYRYAPDHHWLLDAAGVTREYDPKGNTTRIGDRQFVYDETGRMVRVLVNGIEEMNYSYDGLGHQTARYIAEDVTVAAYDEGGHWIGDYDSEGRPIREIVWLGDRPVAAIDPEGIYDIESDHLGTPRAVINRATGTVVWTWPIYGDPFGADKPDEDPDQDGRRYIFDMRFPGQRYDKATGLFQNGWRDYDPSSGRYVQSDPLGVSAAANTYAYAAGDPYTEYDPQGLLVHATFYISEGLLQIYDLDRPGHLVEVDARSGGTFQSQNFFDESIGKEIPVGRYQILNHPKQDWFRLDPLDDNPLNDVHEESGRSSFRLHAGRISNGCITVPEGGKTAAFYSDTFVPVIRNTAALQTVDYARPVLGMTSIFRGIRFGRPRKEPITFFGTLDVLP